MKKIRHKKRTIFVLIITILVMIFGFVEYQKFFGKKEVTQFQDSSGRFYSCSKPIPAKWESVPHLIGEPTRELVAKNPQDITQYCRVDGIE